MRNSDSTQKALAILVEQLVGEYREQSSVGLSKGTKHSPDEFVATVENELRSTLRERLAVVDFDPGCKTTQMLPGNAPDVNAPPQKSGSADTEVLQPTNPNTASATGENDITLVPRQVDAARQPADTLHAPELPDGYDFLGVLGQGGMGVVYKAAHRPLNRTVALKMVLAGSHASPSELSRFHKEAEAAAHLNHPNIVPIYEVGEHKGLPYLSLEYVEGQTLAQLMSLTTLDARASAKLVAQLASAVQYSHAQGVLHRDLKPHNILLDKEDTPKVTDFGLAKRLDDATGENTQEGTVLGTPGYMSPEQARGSAAVGPQADVYSLGAILYYLITGRAPFKGPSTFETIRQVLELEPVAPSELQAGLDTDLETICLKALEKDPAKRYLTAKDLSDELQRFLDGKPILARPITKAERLGKWCKRNPKIATLSGVVASLLVCLVVGGIASSVVLNKQKNAEVAARQDAEASAEIAEQNLEIADQQTELALDTTRVVLFETRKFFEKKTQLNPLRETLLNDILKRVERIHSERFPNDITGIFKASAAAQLGDIYLEANKPKEALEKLLHAEQEAKRLNKDGSLNRADVSMMNLTLSIGDCYRRLGELDKAEARYVSLLEQKEAYFKRHDFKNKVLAEQSRAEAYGRLCKTYRLLGQPDKALEFGKKSVDARRQWHEEIPDSYERTSHLTGALMALSEVYESNGDTAAMVEVSTEQLKLQTELAEGRSDFASLYNTALSQKKVARQGLLADRAEQSKALLATAAETMEVLLDRDPDDNRCLSMAADTYYWQGAALEMLAEETKPSFDRAIQLQRQICNKSKTVNTRGMLLKILARAGEVDEATKLADEMADESDQMMSCGYAACGYALLSEHLETGSPEHTQAVTKAVDLATKLVRHGYRDFEALRTTDLDFKPLQTNADYLAMLDQEETATTEK